MAFIGISLYASVHVFAQDATPTTPPFEIREYAVPAGSHPHDVAPADDGTVWYTSQFTGEVGQLDPQIGKVKLIKLGENSAPHGIIAGADGKLWITDSGLNAIVRVDPITEEVKTYPLPISASTNLNTAVFGPFNMLWFTGQAGYYGRLDPETEKVDVYEAPRGRGPYGITVTPEGEVYYASLAGNHIARINLDTAEAEVIEPPTANQGARRVWSDSLGRIWVSEFNAGQVSVYDRLSDGWREWKLPGDAPRAYAVYVDVCDMVWLSDFGSNAILRFKPDTETFDTFPLPDPNAAVRQIAGRNGEIWGAESGADKLIVIRSDCNQ
jgi:virginiamycin B lyase